MHNERVAIDLSSSFTASNGVLKRLLKFSGSCFESQVPFNELEGENLAGWWRSYLAGNSPIPSEERGTLRVLELFSGPGGLFQGFRQACREIGYDAVSVAAVDEDRDALEIYRKNHGTGYICAESAAVLVNWEPFNSADGLMFFDDPEVARDWLRPLVGNIDVILAGPPCQGHSNLNNHTRRTDARNELYLEVPALARALGAKFVVIENVPAVVHDESNVVGAAWSLLESSGYSVEGGVVKADKIGWPQTRQRYFMVAAHGSRVLDPSAVADEMSEEPLSVMWAIGDLEDHESSNFMDRHTVLSGRNRERVEHLHSAGEFNLGLHLRPDCHQEGTTYTSVYGRMFPDKPAPTLTTGFMTPGRGRFVHPTRPRVLTPREAARIQGFPDTYDFGLSDEGSPKSKLAKWIGDAVPMPLGYVAGLAVLLESVGHSV